MDDNNIVGKRRRLIIETGKQERAGEMHEVIVETIAPKRAGGEMHDVVIETVKPERAEEGGDS